MKKPISFVVIGIIFLATLLVGQAISYVLAPNSWRVFIGRLPSILSMIAFWGPIIAMISGLIVWGVLRLLGFNTLEEVRLESVEQNNPAPAIVFVGTLVASLLFLMLVIRP